LILAIEGPSAVGKTTWCRAHFPENLVPEAPKDIDAPNHRHSEPAAVADFWVKHNIEAWQRALQLECETGIAVCDSDTLHLYYSWALWQSRAIGPELFEIELPLYRSALEQRRLGFADLVLTLNAPIVELRRRAQADATHRRRQHETHLALIPWMQGWFCARERVLPGTVHPWREDLPVRGLVNSEPVPQRYDPAILDRMMEELGRRPTGI
jgi:hypothetical protein